MNQTLLIAEGDADFRNAYRKFLMARGYDVEIASSGLDCLAKLRRSTPAAIVLDRELQWGGGDGVLAWLREDKGANAVPVILTTTAGQRPDVADAAEPPVVRLLLKPFALTALLDSVRAAVSKNGREEPMHLNRAYSGPELFIG
jgi:DNA-binding response OmpR family regulator